MDKQNIDAVRDFYDNAPQTEWDRLERQPFEFELTTYMMDKYIRPGDSVLDIGGGPGEGGGGGLFRLRSQLSGAEQPGPSPVRPCVSHGAPLPSSE